MINIKEHIGLVHKVYQRYYKHIRLEPLGLTYGDIQQVGLMNLHRASQEFDPQRGMKFSTYAYRVLFTKFEYFFRMQQRDRLFIDRNYSEMLETDNIAIYDNSYRNVESKIEVEKLKKRLRPEVWEPLYLKYIKGEQNTDIAKKLNMSVTQLFRKINRGLEQSRHVLGVK